MLYRREHARCPRFSPAVGGELDNEATANYLAVSERHAESTFFLQQSENEEEAIDLEGPVAEGMPMLGLGTWQNDECIAWARDGYDALLDYSTDGSYMNFLSEETGEEEFAYRENYDRLAELKAEYDPENVFRLNQNVKPAE